MRRGRTLASLATVLGLGLSAAVLTGPSSSSAAQGDCDTAFDPANLVTNQDVNGLTVSQGTTPTAFTGTVLGVLKDGIAPGIDMVMARLSSDEITRVGGIWQGMSGSPVYDPTTGDLIGAVAYGLAYGTTPVAGITPYTAMLNSQGSAVAPKHIAISDSVARTIARKTDVTAAQADSGFTRLRVPVGVSGASPRALQTTKTRPWKTKGVYAAGATGSATGPDASTIIPGGNIAATMSYGDITIGGVGTVTSICDTTSPTTVSAFGHPFNFSGRSTYGLAGADTLYVQEDPTYVPFKVANIGDPLGTIDQDRLTGIFGALGATPATVETQSTVTHGDRSRVGSSFIQTPRSAAEVSFYEALSNHDVTLDAVMPGSEGQTWTIEGHTGPAGAPVPFTIHKGNRYADNSDITYAGAWDLPDLVWLLSNVNGVTIDSISNTAHVVDDSSTYQMSGLQQRRGGAWHLVDSTHPAVVNGGSTLTLRVLLGGPSKTTVPLSMKVPAKAAGTKGRLYLQQGDDYPFEVYPSPTTLAGVKKLVSGMVRHDQIRSDLVAFTDTVSVDVKGTSGLADKVITGNKRFPVVIN